MVGAGLRIDVVLLEQICSDRLARLRADAQPVVDSISFEVVCLLVGSVVIGSYHPSCFDHATIAGGTLVHGTDPIERTPDATHALHAQYDHKKESSRRGGLRLPCIT